MDKLDCLVLALVLFQYILINSGQLASGPICYACERTYNPEQCRESVTCSNDQACSVQEVTQPHGDVYFWSGCEDDETCSSLAESVVDNSIIIGKRQSGVSRCAYCCSTDLCNKNCSSFVNLAINKPAYQSTVAYNGTPNLAVDGNTEKNYFKGSCMHTASDQYGWWAVDLGQSYHVTRVKLFERDDAGADGRSFHLKVLISTVNATQLDRTSPLFTQCGFYYGHSSDGNTVTIDCPTNTVGRWVRVQQSDPSHEYLHLCEVEVFGF